MGKNTKIVIGCLLLAVIIGVVPLLINTTSEFGGADGAAKDIITNIDPDYKPWVSPILQPPGGETESLLFCLQAALGAGVFGFGLGYLICKKKFLKKDGKK
ncbi:MAG: energy-coupling factor ABC transporter substrate-binding protein [Anaerovoracaceae bacterium]